MITGSCLCGALEYVLHSEPFDCCYCHCGICRKLTGSSGGAYGSVPREHFAWRSDTAAAARYQPTADTTRHFCAVCGSFLLTEHRAEPQNVFVSLGCLDSVIQARPGYHQYAEALPAWVTLHDNLPRFPTWPPENDSTDRS